MTNVAGYGQSLPRDLSLAKDRYLLQRFVPELHILRLRHFTSTTHVECIGLQAEIYATFSPDCAAATAACGLLVAKGDTSTAIHIRQATGLVEVDGTKQNNFAVRAGPIPPANGAGGYDMHVYVDHSMLEIIVNNATAFVVYIAPPENADTVAFADGTSGTLDAWALATANPNEEGG